MSFFVSKSPTSWFTYTLVCSRFLMNEKEEMIGDITLFNTDLQKREMGQLSEPLCEIASEDDRVAALEKCMGVKLSQPEHDGIKGMITAIW
jgi:hypothetical protein